MRRTRWEPVRYDEHEQLALVDAGFADERETRQAIVMWTADDPAAKAVEARLVRYRSTAYGMAPYLELTGAPESARANEPVAREASPLPIRAVAISPSPNGDEATGSLRGLLTSRGYSDVPVLRSSIPFRG